MNDLKHIIAQLESQDELKRELTTELDGVISQLTAMRDRLSGAKKRKARNTGNGVTKAEIEETLRKVRAVNPVANDEEVKELVRNELRSEGKRLNGVAMHLATLIGD